MSPTKFIENENAIPRGQPYENSGDGYCGGAFPPPPPQPLPPSLKINKDSHFIKKRQSPSSSSPSAADVAAAAKPRHPVIIYTHSPKVIHTNPKDFMALVQKLTGMSRSDEDSTAVGDRRGKSPATRDVASNHGEDQNKTVNNSNGSRNHQLQGRNSNRSCYAGNRRGIFVNNAIFTEDSESSSVITTEENIGEQGQVNSSSCSFAAVPPPYPPPPPPSPAMFDVASSSTSPAINYGAYLSGIPIFATNPSDGFHCVSNESLANFEMDPMFFAPNMRSSFSSSSSSGFDGLTEFRDF